MKRILGICLFVALIGYFVFMLVTVAEHAVKGPIKKFHDSKEIVEWARSHLPQTGVLKEDDGFIYLKVDDGYINQLIPFLNSPRYRKPPYFRHADSPGAHISVMYRSELKPNTKIPELGQSFAFTLSDVVYVPPRYRNYVVIQVKAPELEALRQEYGLSPLLKDHEFHITIAKKKRGFVTSKGF